MKFVKREYITYIIILSIIVLTACDQRYNTYNPIPEMPVNYTLNIVRDAPILMTQGGFISITEPNKSGQYIGYGGLLIFYGFDNYYYAYDLSCPHECKKDVRVIPSMAGIAECPECKTKYDIGFGTGMPSGGESEYGLRRYTVTISGENLRVTK